MLLHISCTPVHSNSRSNVRIVGGKTLKFTRRKNSWAKTGWCSHKPNVPIWNILTKERVYQILDLKYKWTRPNWWQTMSDPNNVFNGNFFLAKTPIHFLGKISYNIFDVSYQINLGKSQLFWAKDKCIRSNYFGQSRGKVVLWWETHGKRQRAGKVSAKEALHA